jgi:5-deoxy-5-amino-3-dehydroquinate synthase
LPAGVDDELLITVMARDKKMVDDGLTFVLDGPDGLEVVRGVKAAAVRDALEELHE